MIHRYYWTLCVKYCKLPAVHIQYSTGCVEGGSVSSCRRCGVLLKHLKESESFEVINLRLEVIYPNNMFILLQNCFNNHNWVAAVYKGTNLQWINKVLGWIIAYFLLFSLEISNKGIRVGIRLETSTCQRKTGNKAFCLHRMDTHMAPFSLD